MRSARKRGGLLLCLLGTLAACGKHAPTTAESGAGAASAPTPAASAPASTAAAPDAVAPQKSTAQNAVEPSTIPRLNEDGSETVEDTTGDNGKNNPLLAAVASTAAAATSMDAPTIWQEGVNYTLLVPAQPTSVPAGQVEVLEFFWYGCPHCYALDPLIEAWQRTKPAYITFTRVPIMWNEPDRALARLYYTLKDLGKIDAMHTAIFREIHENNDPLVDAGGNDAATERLQTAFVESKGVPAAAFRDAYRSVGVESELQNADQLVERYRITGVPTFVINGKFVSDPIMAQSQERLMALVGDLAALEHGKH
jgi:thiol:disulfide interchange protein DsbA